MPNHYWVHKNHIVVLKALTTNKKKINYQIVSTGNFSDHRHPNHTNKIKKFIDYNNLKKDVHLTSIAGGTDLVGCLVLGNLFSDVYKGEIQGQSLAIDVDVFTENGKSTKDYEKGELVVKQPFPSMPVKFWGDDGGKKYHEAYFTRFKNIWHHGDFVERTSNNGFIVSGRSDATLNPGGVRIGTSEIYQQVENIDFHQRKKKQYH